MGSSNYQINWDSVNSGGVDVATSTNYLLRDTVGEQATGFSSSTNYTVSAGYRTGDQDLTYLSFQIGTQENTTQVSYSAFDASAKTVTVSSASGYAIGDLVGVVEDVGLNEKVAFGKITDIVGTLLTVDNWQGEPSSLSAVPSGGNDSVYRMNGASAELGTLSPSTGKSSLTGTRVTSNAQNGYTVDVSDDGDFRDGSNSITNVTDGSVTIGSEEYGASVIGDQAVGAGTDFGFSTSVHTIQSSASSTSGNEGVALVYKASVTVSTPAGNYGQTVFYTLTANY